MSTAIPRSHVAGLKVSIRTDEGVARILDDVSVDARAGRIVGVVGESGCGKSTLIRAILGILPSGARSIGGKIWFEGENLLAFSEEELNRDVRGSRIGFIPQDPLLALNPVFKVGTQLLEAMRWHAPGHAGGTTSRAAASMLLAAHAGARPARRAGALSAPVLRRPAPAPADRRGARLRARAW